MDTGPLVVQKIDAGARLIHEFDRVEPLQAAFWLKESEDDQWFLYLAGERIDDTNFGAAYGAVLRITSMSPDPWLDPFEVKVIGAGDSLAKAVIEIQKRRAGKMPIRYNGPPLGGMSVEEVYIYPLPVALPS